MPTATKLQSFATYASSASDVLPLAALGRLAAFCASVFSCLAAAASFYASSAFCLAAAASFCASVFSCLAAAASLRSFLRMAIIFTIRIL